MYRKTFYLILTLPLCLLFVSCDDEESYSQEDMEEAYFEGQKDALMGDIRIQKDEDGCWVWTKSPWDKQPDIETLDFDPSKGCDE